MAVLVGLVEVHSGPPVRGHFRRKTEDRAGDHVSENTHTVTHPPALPTRHGSATQMGGQLKGEVWL